MLLTCECRQSVNSLALSLLRCTQAGSHLRYGSVAGGSDVEGSTRRSLAPPSTGYGPSLFSSTLRGGSPYLAHRKTVPGKVGRTGARERAVCQRVRGSGAYMGHHHPNPWGRGREAT